jgi:hypothetical protein
VKGRIVRRPLLSIRAALVFTLAALVAVGAGALSTLGGTSPARSVLYGVAAFGAAVTFFDRIIADSDPGGP